MRQKEKIKESKRIMRPVGKVKSAFEWNDGTPSIWSRDAELKRKIQGQEWAKKVQAKKDINDKAQVFIYCKANAGKN